MSVYADYDDECSGYDDHRLPIGVDDILKEIRNITGKSAKDLHILDAGCGTGNYSVAMLDAGVGRLTLLDASEGMLYQARTKIKSHQKRKSVDAIIHGVLPIIPFPDNSFDVVMFNKVLHHLNDNSENKDSFKNTATTIREAFRVLKHGGVIIVSTCMKHQIDAVWYTRLQPQFTWRYKNRFPGLDQLRQMLKVAGLYTQNVIPIVDAEWSMAYRNPDGPLYEAWRKIDSFWSCFPKGELNAIVKTVEVMKAKGTLDKFVDDNDKTCTVGQMTVISATAGKKN